MNAWGCDICDVDAADPVIDLNEVDGVFRCERCHAQYLRLLKQYPDRF